MKNIPCLLKDDIINLQMKTARQNSKMNCILWLCPCPMALLPLSILAPNRGLAWFNASQSLCNICYVIILEYLLCLFTSLQNYCTSQHL